MICKKCSSIMQVSYFERKGIVLPMWICNACAVFQPGRPNLPEPKVSDILKQSLEWDVLVSKEAAQYLLDHPNFNLPTLFAYFLGQNVKIIHLSHLQRLNAGRGS